MSLDLYVHHFEPARTPGLPTIVALHGTGGNERDLLGLTRMIAPGCAIISPRGNVSENGMPRFFRRFAEGVFDLEDVERRAHELATFVASAATHYGCDPRNLYALGYSNGANIAVASMLVNPGVFKGALLLRAQQTYVPETPPNLRGKAIFMSSGRHDQLISTEQSDALYGQLRDCGAAVSLAWQEANHGLIQSDVEMAAGWLNALIA